MRYLRPIRFLALFACLWLALAACAQETLTIRIVNADGKGVSFNAEIADTPDERARGLQGREDFGKTEGEAMLFVYGNAAPRAFWMKDTPVSLDIIFFDDDGTFLNTHAHTTPGSLAALASRGDAQFVLEIPAGEAARLGIGRGSRIYGGQ